MYHFRYYAIGHSYLKHSQFEGWQTESAWGMAATEPSKDYFHQFQSKLKLNFDCKVDALAENIATYERLCVKGITAEEYKKSEYYKHMKAVIENFKPNIITVFVGGGNTVANDEASLSMFYDVLFDMVNAAKLPETVVICPALNKYIYDIMLPVVNKYNFIMADTSYINNDQSRNNPYYAFKQYPEYDAMAEKGAIEFRSHPGDYGHLNIAETIYEAARDTIIRKIPQSVTDVDFVKKDDRLPKEEPLKIVTEPEINVKFGGFNVMKTESGVELSSAPGTGASIYADDLHIGGFNKLYAQMSIDGDITGKKLELKLQCGNTFKSVACDIKEGMTEYVFDLSETVEHIDAFWIVPLSVRECRIEIKSIKFF